MLHTKKVSFDILLLHSSWRARVHCWESIYGKSFTQGSHCFRFLNPTSSYSSQVNNTWRAQFLYLLRKVRFTMWMAMQSPGSKNISGLYAWSRILTPFIQLTQYIWNISVSEIVCYISWEQGVSCFCIGTGTTLQCSMDPDHSLLYDLGAAGYCSV